MKRARYLIVVARNGTLTDSVKARLNASNALGGFEQLRASDRAIMFVEGPQVAFDRGGIAGWVFTRGRAGPIANFSSGDAELIRAGKGQYLIEAHWGGYVALIERDVDVVVLRSPLSDLACLMAETAEEIVIASDVALLSLLIDRPSVDVEALARYLASPDLRMRETCLAGVSELQGGLRLSVGERQHATEECWSPWKFAGRDRQFDQSDEARARLRDSIFHAVSMTCGLHGPVVLRLSGGLDSSIVAASLAHGGIAAAAINLATEDLAGDEMRYARMVAEHVGMRLEKRSRRLDHVDLMVSAARGQPRPVARAFAQAAIAPSITLAHEIGAGALVDGGGGDNVFCSLQSIRPVIDAMMMGEPWRTTRAAARSIAAISQVSEWTVLRRAWVGRARGMSRYDFPFDQRFLSPAAVEAAKNAGKHRWLDCPTGALPGKAAHVGIIAAAQSVVESFDPSADLPLVSPLITQPVVETCLRIPTWWWYERGLNRAVARTAFAGLLPTAIVERRSKGGLDSFIAELFQQRRGQIAAILLDGLLAERGLLDRSALAVALAENGPVQSIDFMRIMRLADVEVWARSY